MIYTTVDYLMHEAYSTTIQSNHHIYITGLRKKSYRSPPQENESNGKRVSIQILLANCVIKYSALVEGMVAI